MESNSADKFTDATIDDILADPERFGAPTFDEFVRNRDKYMGRPDESLAQVDKGSTLLSRHRVEQRYKALGYRCSTLEEVEKVILNEGYQLREIKYKVNLVTENDQLIQEIDFVPTHKRSGLIVPT